MPFDRFALLRKILSSPPSNTSWEGLYTLLFEWPNTEERELALHYTQEHLQDWPDQVRDVPYRAFLPAHLRENRVSLWPLFRVFDLDKITSSHAFLPRDIPHPTVLSFLPFHPDTKVRIDEGVFESIPAFDMAKYRQEAQTEGIAPSEIGTLLCRSGPGRQRAMLVPLTRKTMTIGRSTKNDLCIDGDFVSRVHCWITYEDGSYVVQDGGSSSGIYVNNTHQHRYKLKDGDTLAIGRTLFHFVQGQSIQEAAYVFLSEYAVQCGLTKVWGRPLMEELLDAKKHFLSFADEDISHEELEASWATFRPKHMHNINNAFGHLIGDQLLQAVAAYLQQSLPPGSSICRWEGTIFAVFLDGMGLPEARQWVQETIDAFPSPALQTQNHTIHAELEGNCVAYF